ncbi:MAG TPA: hypothetical protein PK957_03060 [Candidatus Dojkabacteria bacterium]|nr:hypothetical protein [Candidatus Dojkabacteria bacterium]
MISIDEAIEKGYLEKRVVYLKPIGRKTGMVNDEKHVAYFKMDGASDRYCLKVDEHTQKVVNPFTKDGEMEYFSQILGEDLNPYKKNNEFWGSFNVTITKTPELMKIGKKFDLSNPRENLEYKVLKTWKKEISNDWDSRFNGQFRYAFVNENYEEEKAISETQFLIEIGEALGKLQGNNDKMRDFINIYYMNKSKNVSIPQEADTKFLIGELKKIVDVDKEGFISLFKDKAYNTKVLIAKAINKGVVLKQGVGTYIINGVDTKYSYGELIAQMKHWEQKPDDPIYAKIIAVTKQKDKAKVED